MRTNQVQQIEEGYLQDRWIADSASLPGRFS
jgi:hypothetical protein